MDLLVILRFRVGAFPNILRSLSFQTTEEQVVHKCEVEPVIADVVVLRML